MLTDPIDIYIDQTHKAMGRHLSHKKIAELVFEKFGRRIPEMSIKGTIDRIRRLREDVSEPDPDSHEIGFGTYP